MPANFCELSQSCAALPLAVDLFVVSAIYFFKKQMPDELMCPQIWQGVA